MSKKIKRLRKARLDKGWTGMKLATEAGLHPSQISKFETGREIPYDKQLERLAAALGIPQGKAHTLLDEVAP